MSSMVHHRERDSNDITNIPPPTLPKLLIPLNSQLQPILKLGLLIPTQTPQFSPVNSVSKVVERSVLDVLDDFVVFLGWVVEFLDEVAAEVSVGDFVVGPDVVDLADGALVEDCVEGVCCVASKEVTAGVHTASVKEKIAAAVEEAGEFGDDLYKEVK